MDKNIKEIDPRARYLHGLSGNALKVLITMGVLGGVNVGNKAIHKKCGLSLPTIATCLVALSAFELVTQTHRTDGWQITANGFDLLLGPEASTKFFDSAAINNKLKDSLTRDKELNTINTSEKVLHSPKNYDPKFDPAKDVRDEIDQTAHAILLSFGVYEPTATELAHLVWVDHQYLEPFRIWVKTDMLDLALSIWQIRHRWPAPKLNKNQHPEGCKCNDCYYLGWSN